MRLARHVWTVYGGYALGFASLFVIWQLASIYLVSSVLFPPPTVVFKKGLLLVKNGVLKNKVPGADLVTNDLIDDMNKFDAKEIEAMAKGWKR